MEANPIEKANQPLIEPQEDNLNNIANNEARLNTSDTLYPKDALNARKALFGKNMSIWGNKNKAVWGNFLVQCKSLGLKAKKNTKENVIEVKNDGGTTTKIGFAEVDNQIFLKLSYSANSRNQAYELLESIVNKIAPNNGDKDLTIGGKRVILPKRKVVVIQKQGRSSNPNYNSNLNYSANVDSEIETIGKLQFKENFDIQSEEQKNAAVKFTALAAIDDELYSTPLEDWGQRIEFLTTLKSHVNASGIGQQEKNKLSKALDKKIDNLKNNFSYSKKSFDHVVDLYKSALKEKNVQNNNLNELENLKGEYQKESYENFAELSQKAKSLYLKSFLPNGKKEPFKFFVCALNKCKATWETIKNKFKFIDNQGNSHQFESTSTPARELSVFKYLSKDGIRGISSNDKESEHLLNAWETKLENSKGEVVIKAIRHGCTKGIQSRTEELLQFAMVEQGCNLEELQENQEVSVKLSSAQLLTHTNIAGDGNMGIKQAKELQKYVTENGAAIKITKPNGGTVTVNLKLDLLTFNFGVNMQACWGLGRPKEENELNRESLEKLIGKDFLNFRNDSLITAIGDFENAGGPDANSELGKKLHSIDEAINAANNSNQDNNQEVEKLKKEREILITLAKQIKSMWVNGTHKPKESGPYAMPARVAYLSYKLGYLPSFNCKSGKDRTGLMDAELKNLAAYIEANGKVPPLYGKFNKTDRKNLTTIHTKCGSPEILFACMGIMGTQTPGMRKFHAHFQKNYDKELLGMTAHFKPTSLKIPKT